MGKSIERALLESSSAWRSTQPTDSQGRAAGEELLPLWVAGVLVVASKPPPEPAFPIPSCVRLDLSSSSPGLRGGEGGGSTTEVARAFS